MAGSLHVRRWTAAACAAIVALSLVACAPEASEGLDLPTQVDASFSDEAQAQLQGAVDLAVAASGSTGAIVGVWAPWAGTWLKGVGTVAPEGKDTLANIRATGEFVVNIVSHALRDAMNRRR